MQRGFISTLKRNLRDIQHTYTTLVRVHFIGTLLTIAVVAVSLTIPMVFYMLLSCFAANTTDLSAGRNITVYLKSDVDPEQAVEIKNNLLKDERIKEVSLIVNTQGLKSFAESLGINEGDVLADDINPLPHALIVTPSSIMDNDDNALESYVREIKNNRSVELVRMDKEWFRKLRAIADTVRFITTVVALVLITSLVLTIINTVSHRVLLHREEIEVMKLVGATDGYIVGPYIYLGMWLGFLGSFVAWWLSTIIVFFTEKYIGSIAEQYGSTFVVRGYNATEVCLLFGVTIVLCMIVSYVTAKNRIGKINPK